MKGPRPMALRRLLPADPALGVVKNPIHNHDKATSNLAPAKKNRVHGQGPTKTVDYLVTIDLPGDPSIGEAELRAIEILLGGDLKAILAGTTIESLKPTEFKR